MGTGAVQVAGVNVTQLQFNIDRLPYLMIRWQRVKAWWNFRLKIFDNDKESSSREQYRKLKKERNVKYRCSVSKAFPNTDDEWPGYWVEMSDLIEFWANRDFPSYRYWLHQAQSILNWFDDRTWKFERFLILEHSLVSSPQNGYSYFQI